MSPRWSSNTVLMILYPRISEYFENASKFQLQFLHNIQIQSKDNTSFIHINQMNRDIEKKILDICYWNDEFLIGKWCIEREDYLFQEEKEFQFCFSLDEDLIAFKLRWS